LAHNLVKYVAPAALKAGLPATSIVAFLTAIGAGNLVAVEAVPGVTPAVLHAAAGASVTAYEKSFQTIYLVTLAFGCCAIIASLLVDSEKLEEKMTTDIARKLQGVEKKPLEKEEDLKV
jgi:type VI protein secretion system component VasA